jgi:trans-aconitate methyltransferase
VLGIDSSAEMIEAAESVRASLPADSRQRLRFELADVTDWQPAARSTSS